MSDAPWLLTAAVAIHLAASASHGWAHTSIPVNVPAWQLAFVAVVIAIVPVLGAGLFVAGRHAVGAWTVLLSGTAALAFEGLAHFVVANPDHVGAVENGAVLFASTAGLTTVSDALLVLVAAWTLRRQARGTATSSAIASIR